MRPTAVELLKSLTVAAGTLFCMITIVVLALAGKITAVAEALIPAFLFSVSSVCAVGALLLFPYYLVKSLLASDQDSKMEALSGLGVATCIGFAAILIFSVAIPLWLTIYK